jgi:hypothetical protein
VVRIEDVRPGDSMVALGVVESVELVCGDVFEVAFSRNGALASAIVDATGGPFPLPCRPVLVFDAGARVGVLR